MKSPKSFCLLLIFLVMGLLIIPILGFSRQNTPKDLYFQPKGWAVPQLVDMSSISPNKPQLLERKKIQILIGLIALSPYTFIRNGNEYTGDQAASHLRTKYRYAYDRIKTARHFIEYIASKSSMSGTIYETETAYRVRYYTRDILYNELDRLNSSLIQNSP